MFLFCKKNKRMFYNREDAGKQLAEKLMMFKNEHPVILALPRGGVPVGFVIAKQLHAPLDVLIARKLGAPYQKELGIGAISEGGVRVLNTVLIERNGVTKEEVSLIEKEEREELWRRVHIFRNGKPLSYIKGKTVIVVDDGLATGITALAAIKAVKKLQPEKVIYASPVCAADSILQIQKSVSVCFCLYTPSYFHAVGEWYQDFTQVSDEEVITLLAQRRS
jgi:putative phosphoribosyl transferase